MNPKLALVAVAPSAGAPRSGRLGIVTQAWSPLGGVNRYATGDEGEVKDPLVHPTIVELADKYAKTPAQVVLRWHLDHGLSVIPKSVRPARIEENIDIFDFELAADEVAAIDAIDSGEHGGPDPELLDNEMFDFVIDNDV